MLASDKPAQSRPSTQKKRFRLKAAPSGPLTKKELTVLNAMVLDYTREEMSAMLDMPAAMLKFCIKSIYNKLGVDNRREAIREAVAHSMIELPQDQSVLWSVL